jgi:signal transduction histidine kinase
LEFLKTEKTYSPERLHHCSTYLQDAVCKLNRLFAYLRIPAFNELGFTATLEQLIETIGRSTGASIDLACASYDWDLLTEPTKLLLYRTLSDRLEHCLKNETNSVVKITLSVSEGTICLTIVDSVKGNENNEDEKKDICVLQNRIRFYGGELQIRHSGVFLRIMKIRLPLVIGPLAAPNIHANTANSYPEALH